MRPETKLLQATDAVRVTPCSAFHAEFLKHSVGQELLKKLCDFISTTWDIDATTSNLYVKEAVLSIEAQMRRSCGIDPPRDQGGLGICRVQRVTKFIDANLHQRISVTDLARVVKLRSSQFQRAFKQSFGEAPHTYLIKQRIERAKTMIANSDISTAEIAIACGFADQSHMTRLFTRFVGESPSSWRRNWSEL